MFDNKTVLITGGTGSFGQKFAETLLARYTPRRLIIFSRDELKQYEMSRALSPKEHGSVRYFIGDIRDRERLYRAFDGVDIVIHAAALKQVPLCEYNPFEAVKTNVIGAANVIDAAIDRNVGRVVALSTDKAADPVNLYGATKLCADKLFTAAKSYSGGRDTRFSVVRYGNVVCSRGSVIPYFMSLRESGEIPITDMRMTRFWITLEQSVEFVFNSLEQMQGDEIFIPKIPSMRIADLARAIAPECKLKVIGIRPGEKLHEVMISENHAANTLEYDDYFVTLPSVPKAGCKSRAGGRVCPEGFSYRSDNNSQWLSEEALQRMVN